MKKIGNVLTNLGLVVIFLPITILLVAGIAGFLFGCTGAVTGGGVTCANSSASPIFESMQALGFMMGIYGIWFVGLPALLIGFVLKAIGGKNTPETSPEGKTPERQ